ncbi:MAG: A/G-specific adenine glycosylase [Hyphomicrobiales bacterium]|nr:A/G-specific adenine glycosylase [Hyphomicrobiales bacterium]
MAASAADRLLSWYDRHGRKLPWRAPPGVRPDPYAVWLSEIMLQQTTVAAVGPYFHRFIERWPNVEALAGAADEEVMRQWAGLGYYSRARNLIACARQAAAAGGFPQTEEGLRELPGVGPYTAAAIAAIAFGRRAVVVDGNVERVVARFFAVETPLPAAKPEIRARTNELTPDARAGDFAQAMMDLGATICTPKRPACALCPLSDDCLARKTGAADTFPRRAPKPKRPLRRGAAFVAIRADGAILLRTRPPKGLLGGMTEFPGSSWSPAFDAAEIERAAPLPLRWRMMTGEVTHVFTHFELRLQVLVGEAEADRAAPPGARWTPASALHAEALPSVMRKVAELAGLDATRRK